MSLTISLYRRNGSTVEELDVLDASQSVAGVESTRKGLWGSTQVIERGASLLPQLAEGALWVEPEDLDKFRQECELLLRHVVEISGEWGVQYVEERIKNFINAVDLAEQHQAGIIID
jgi:hypothetical protein